MEEIKREREKGRQKIKKERKKIAEINEKWKKRGELGKENKNAERKYTKNDKRDKDIKRGKGE